jgi:hypothetical protein
MMEAMYLSGVITSIFMIGSMLACRIACSIFRDRVFSRRSVGEKAMDDF